MGSFPVSSRSFFRNFHFDVRGAALTSLQGIGHELKCEGFFPTLNVLFSVVSSFLWLVWKVEAADYPRVCNGCLLRKRRGVSSQKNLDLVIIFVLIVA